MGKNFPDIKRLSEKPELFTKTLQLIEKSFKYNSPHSFKEDFAPLIDSSNHHNCFILVDENENVLGHIGVREAKIEIDSKEHPIAMLGGIAVDEDHRGKGYFQYLLNDVLSEKRSDVAFFLLWSDNEELYNKFGFHLCGQQFEFSQEGNAEGFYKAKYHLLPNEEKQQIRELYQSSFAKEFLSIHRSPEDWQLLEKITSADLFYKKTDLRITDYFFMNKGQDLGGIIYEYASSTNLKELVSKMRGHGTIWSPKPYLETENVQYQFFLCPGDQKKISDFFLDYTNGQIQLRLINQMKGETFFDFNQETLSVQTEDFLRGIMGPGIFEELGDIRPVFVSGLDSI